MLEVGQQEDWNVLLKRHIELLYSKNFQYKTTLEGSEPHLYLVVTRVNYLTACLWLEQRNKIVSNGKSGNYKGFVDLPAKPNWLVMTASFRREENERLKNINV